MHHRDSPDEKLDPVMTWSALTWPDSHILRGVGYCWSRFCALQSRVGVPVPNGPKAGTPGNPGHTWEGLPQPHQENPRIFPESRTLKGASAPSQRKAMWGVNSYQPGQSLQDSTILSSLTAAVCLIWAWLSWAMTMIKKLCHSLDSTISLAFTKYDCNYN